MGLIDQAKIDMKDIITDIDGFGVAMSFTAPTAQTAAITGLHTKHHLSFNSDGIAVNSKNAHCSFAEKSLTELNYPFRNAKGEVYLKGHRVNIKDSTGITKLYVIREFFPNETIGMITCILGDFE